jgi:hypothetical protein
MKMEEDLYIHPHHNQATVKHRAALDRTGQSLAFHNNED